MAAYIHVAGPHPFHQHHNHTHNTHNAPHDAADAYLDLAPPAQHLHYPNQPMHDSAASAYYNPNNVPPPMACDIKPRLTKEQHDILESHYQKQNKPNTNTKKGFAENLSVSLDKVNNWFQNRRAKAKQDAKKQAGAYNLYSQQPGSTLNFSSDSDASPSFASTDYFSMMQQCSPEEQMTNGAATGQPQQQQFHDQVHHGLSYSNDATPAEAFTTTAAAAPSQHLSADLFDSPQELNRRTLTQEQFDAFANTGGMMDSSGNFDGLHDGISGDADVLQRLFPDMQPNDYKQHDSFSCPVPVGAPPLSNDSSVPSTISEQSMFSSSSAMQEHAATSTTPSDWTDSRSSSVSLAPGQEQLSYPHIPAPASQNAVTTFQWQPGQSVPVDPNEMQQQFREAAQRSVQQETQHEQPVAWPGEEALVRRESHNSTMLAQQMSSFAIQTPLPQQSATFQRPAPPGEGTSSIAARRQRPRPAPLGGASLRSQSYSGAAQPGSPSQPSQNLAPGQQLRRIRSSNVIGGVAQGRVMKSMPGSAQRSPLSWTFADSLNSPKAVRHASSGSIGNLAPPTPLSPSEQGRPQFPPWQSTSSGHFSRHESISETDAEHDVLQHSSAAAATSQSVSSPPHTPMYHHHHHQPQHSFQSQPQFAQVRVGSNVVTANTPPQSAPAAQQTFPADVCMLPQQHQPAPCHPPMQMHFIPQQEFANVAIPPQQFSMPPAMYSSARQFTVPVSESQAHIPMQFSNGVPMVDAHGNLTLGFPPPMQRFVQHSPPQVHHQHTNAQFNFVGTSAPTPSMHIKAQIPKQPMQQTSEFFVHEYSPPQEIKRQATQRKVTSESGPRIYTFANQGPEHFEKEKSKKGLDIKVGTASSSPASAASSL